MGMSLIRTVTASAGTVATIDFDNIPQTGTHLLLTISSRVSTSGFGIQMTFNGNTANNYAYQYLVGDGSGRYASRLSTQPNINLNASNGGTDAANIFASHEVTIYDYSSSQTKSVSVNSAAENDQATPAYHGIVAGDWLVTSPITSISLKPEGTATFAQHTSASLYRINTL